MPIRDLHDQEKARVEGRTSNLEPERTECPRCGYAMVKDWYCIKCGYSAPRAG